MSEQRFPEYARPQSDFELGLDDGRSCAGGISGAFIDNLRDDLPEIERALDRRGPRAALVEAAHSLGMETVELYSLLPKQTGDCLRGFLRGLLEASEDRCLQPTDEQRKRWARERRAEGRATMNLNDDAPRRRRLYG